MIKWTVMMIGLFTAVSLGTITSCGDDDDSSTDSDSDSDGDTDTDTDTDTDADSDTDTDADSDTDSDADCTNCHGHPPATGHHGAHSGSACSVCHGTVVNSSDEIIDMEAHTDGTPDVTPGSGTYEDGICSNTGCHSSPITW